MKLYEINQQIREVLNQVDEDGQLPESAYEQLSKLDIALDDKHEAYACVCKEFKENANMLKAEADRLTKRQKTLEKKAEWFKMKLAESMTANGKEKLETSKCYLYFTESKACIVTNELMLPKKYFKIESKPDITAIKEALAQGQKVRGALIEVRKNLQIK